VPQSRSGCGGEEKNSNMANISPCTESFCTKFWSENVKGGHRLEDLGEVERIILE
jgi:hypothetical protein